MIDEATPTPASQPEGTTGAATASPAQPAPAPEPLTLTERVVSDAEVEIKKLAQELHDKIVALMAEVKLGEPMTALNFAKRHIEDLWQDLQMHFGKTPL